MSEESDVKAREVGWTPKEQFKGDPNRWVDSEKFLERSDNNMGMLKENNEKLYTTVEELNGKIGKMEETFTEFKDFHKQSIDTAKQQGYESAREKLMSEQRSAVDERDTESFDRIETQKRDLEEEYRKAAAPKTEEPKVDPDNAAWRAQNTWYDRDADMTAEANAVGAYVNERYNLSGRAFYDKVTEEMQKRMPDKFDNPNRDAPSTVDEGGAAPRQRNRKPETFENLPADAKAACDKYVKSGLMTKDQYVAEYDWSE